MIQDRDCGDENDVKPSRCGCYIGNREEHESQRDWLKRCMCMYHWMETDYYRDKLTDVGASRWLYDRLQQMT